MPKKNIVVSSVTLLEMFEAIFAAYPTSLLSHCIRRLLYPDYGVPPKRTVPDPLPSSKVTSWSIVTISVEVLVLILIVPLS